MTDVPDDGIEMSSNPFEQNLLFTLYQPTHLRIIKKFRSAVEKNKER